MSVAELLAFKLLFDVAIGFYKKITQGRGEQLSHCRLLPTVYIKLIEASLSSMTVTVAPKSEPFSEADVARLAQSVEHETLNLRVVGSSPTLGEDVLSYTVCSLNKFVKVWSQISQDDSV